MRAINKPCEAYFGVFILSGFIVVFLDATLTGDRLAQHNGLLAFDDVPSEFSPSRKRRDWSGFNLPLFALAVCEELISKTVVVKLAKRRGYDTGFGYCAVK